MSQYCHSLPKSPDTASTPLSSGLPSRGGNHGFSKAFTVMTVRFLHVQPVAGPRVHSTQEECNALAAPAPAVSRVPLLILLTGWREQKRCGWKVKSRGSDTAECVPGTLLFSPPIIFTWKHSSLSLQRPAGSRSWSLLQPSGSWQGEQGARHLHMSSKWR